MKVLKFFGSSDPVINRLDYSETTHQSRNVAHCRKWLTFLANRRKHQISSERSPWREGKRDTGPENLPWLLSVLGRLGNSTKVFRNLVDDPGVIRVYNL
ncbi:hypothetical protein AVEN_169251-1 [Araneus ventricosus]|uniref:Uncharacterized protein n=1 Tax=Araneus ventricosus TaxID=182803 RepID=A0A4Y2GHF7_ARAVE|nr:hypothetical protein AVEN_169251-1 [Araneus ventricosus]